MRLKAIAGTRAGARSTRSANSSSGTMDVQGFLREGTAKTMANRHVAVLSDAFRYAKLCGLTEYNPCLGAERHREFPRDREVFDDEIENLLTHAMACCD